jgi:hypothetical protein
MKKEIKERFKNLYPGKRLLAVQLNGFTHKVFYDGGSSDEQITIEDYSPWTTTSRQTKESELLLASFSTYTYKNNPKEIIFLTPEER